MPGRFSLVPVLDLKGGVVVHARAGDRANYRPIRSSLTAGSAPAEIVEALLELAPFRRFYVADLDAIEGVGEQRRVVEDLAEQHPGIEFWLDCGLRTAAAAIALARAGITPVCGSETLDGLGEIDELLWRLGAGGWVLSLDYRGDDFLGPPALAETAALWPERVIAMTLGRVGMGLGPDLARLAAVGHLAAERRVFAAGGVRGADDLGQLAAMGVAGALVATALHDGRLSAELLRRYERA
jgi:phosphoribosylformimino-5-aminoimidazole carboxamide ribotide isomerase